MSTNLTHEGTATIRAIADRALLSATGISITCPSHGDAMKLRQRFNDIRHAERKRNMREREFTDPQYNTSVYDGLETKMDDDGVTLLIRTSKAAITSLIIKDLETGNQISPEDL